MRTLYRNNIGQRANNMFKLSIKILEYSKINYDHLSTQNIYLDSLHSIFPYTHYLATWKITLEFSTFVLNIVQHCGTISKDNQ